MTRPTSVNETTCVCMSQQGLDSPGYNTSAMEQSTLALIGEAYGSVHGIFSLVVCTFGIPMNVLNISVLTRKHMRTPVNCILTWLAVFDLLTMVSYVPFVSHFYCFTPKCDSSASEERNSFGWMTFLIFHVDFTSTTHTISIWLGVTLAMFRYKHIFSPAKGHLTRVRRLIRARIAVFVVVIVSALVMVPNYMMNKLVTVPFINRDTNVTSYIYITDFRDLGTPQVQPITHLNLWFQCALAKFLPCILMVVYGGLLVRTLRTNIRMLNKNQTTRASDSFFPPFNANHSPEHPYTGDHLLQVQSVDETGDSTKENQSDRNTGGGESEELLCSNCKNQVKHQMTIMMKEEQKPKRPSTSPLASGRRGPSRHHDNSRTTRMLLLVITLFLITELPQAILIVLSATIPPFFNEVYLPLGDIMDMVALVNNGINFLLYCVMSRDFRTTLLDMMRSSMTSARRVPGKITTTLYRPTVAIFDRSQKSQGTLIVRSHLLFNMTERIIGDLRSLKKARTDNKNMKLLNYKKNGGSAKSTIL